MFLPLNTEVAHAKHSMLSTLLLVMLQVTKRLAASSQVAEPSTVCLLSAASVWKIMKGMITVWHDELSFQGGTADTRIGLWTANESFQRACYAYACELFRYAQSHACACTSVPIRTLISIATF